MKPEFEKLIESAAEKFQVNLKSKNWRMVELDIQYMLYLLSFIRNEFFDRKLRESLSEEIKKELVDG